MKGISPKMRMTTTFCLFCFRSDKLNFHLKLRTLQEIVNAYECVVCVCLLNAWNCIQSPISSAILSTQANTPKKPTKKFIMLGNEFVVVACLLRQCYVCNAECWPTVDYLFGLENLMNRYIRKGMPKW